MSPRARTSEASNNDGYALVTVINGHPASLSRLGAVAGYRVDPLGVDHFGQSDDIDLRLDVDAILNAAARVCRERR